MSPAEAADVALAAREAEPVAGISRWDSGRGAGSVWGRASARGVGGTSHNVHLKTVSKIWFPKRKLLES